MVFTPAQKNRNRKNDASPLTPKSATFFQIYGMIAALSPLVDAIDKDVQVGMVNNYVLQPQRLLWTL